MGIHRFLQYLNANSNDELLVCNKPSNIVSVWIDMNFILHRIHRRIIETPVRSRTVINKLGETETIRDQSNITKKSFVLEFEQTLNEELNQIVDEYDGDTGSLAVIAIMVDGIPPFAKTVEQRRRRYMKSAVNDRQKKIGMRSAPTDYSSNALTPGTELMIKINKMIKRWIAQLSKLTMHNIDVIYSPHTVPGEGEHKIRWLFDKTVKKLKSGSHLLISNDNDMFILASLLDTEKVYLRKDFDDKGMKYSSISKFVLSLRKLGQNKSDLILLITLLGNDFVPQIESTKSSDSLDRLINSYETALERVDSIITIDDEGEFTINWPIFFDVLTEYIRSTGDGQVTSISEGERMTADRFEMNKNAYAGMSLTGSDTFDFTIYKALWYNRAFGFIDHEQNGKGVMLHDLINKESMKVMVHNYLEAAEWTVSYYLSGSKGISHDWFYPWNYSPFIHELITIGSGYQGSEKIKYDSKAFKSTIIENLLYTMPPTSHQIVPRYLTWCFESDSCLSYMYPQKISVDNLTISIDERNQVILVPTVNKVDIRYAMLATLTEAGIKRPDLALKQLVQTRVPSSYTVSGGHIKNMIPKKQRKGIKNEAIKQLKIAHTTLRKYAYGKDRFYTCKYTGNDIMIEPENKLYRYNDADILCDSAEQCNIQDKPIQIRPKRKRPIKHDTNPGTIASMHLSDLASIPSIASSIRDDVLVPKDALGSEQQPDLDISKSQPDTRPTKVIRSGPPPIISTKRSSVNVSRNKPPPIISTKKKIQKENQQDLFSY
ncbi:MAG: hypothetical protein GY751_00355 [Bacteroidetes bacterium]|nr:hypothetical protein [Bacteroidota bacterium]